MPVVNLPKPKHITTEIYVIPMGTLRLITTPYEVDGGGLPADSKTVDTLVLADNEVGFPTDPTYENVFSFVTSLRNTALGSETTRGKYYFSSYKNFGIGAYKWLTLNSANTTDSGWEFSFTVEGGNDVNHRMFSAGRAIGIYMVQWVDGTDTEPIFRGQVATCYVKYNGGRQVVTSRGRSVLKVNAATLDHFINIPLRSLDFFNLEQANIERAAQAQKRQADIDAAHLTWTTALHDEEVARTALGNAQKPADGSPPNPATVAAAQAAVDAAYAASVAAQDKYYTLNSTPLTDPFLGFGAVIDTYGLTPDNIVLPPVNEKHLISDLSITKAVKHLLSKHVRVSRDGQGWNSLDNEFHINIDTDSDVESKLIYFTKDDGNLLGSIIESCRHGVWLFFCDSLNKLHMIKDYCAVPNSSLDVTGVGLHPNVSHPLMLIPKGAMVGDLTVSMGRADTRVARVEVDGIPQNAEAGGSLSSLNYYTNFGQAFFPAKPLSQLAGGSVVRFTQYQGFNVYHQARCVFAQQNQETTAQVSNYLFANAFSLFNRVVSIKGNDPAGVYNFSQDAISDLSAWVGTGLGDTYSTNAYDGFGKRFRCDSVSITVTQGEDNTGFFNASLSLKEIVYYPRLAGDQPTSDPHPVAYPGSFTPGQGAVQW